jgi:hypothetical protein
MTEENKEIPPLDFLDSISNKPEQVVSNYGKKEDKVKEYKEEYKEEFNKNPSVKKLDLELVDKKNYNLLKIGLIIFIVLSVSLIGILVWKNIILDKMDLNLNNQNTINVEPANVSVPMNVQVNNSDTNKYEINNYNNITLNATIVLPNNLTIKVENITYGL